MNEKLVLLSHNDFYQELSDQGIQRTLPPCKGSDPRGPSTPTEWRYDLLSTEVRLQLHIVDVIRINLL